MATAATGSEKFVEDVLARSASNRMRLSSNDRAIIKYLQQHPTDLAFQTSSSLAESAHVSQAAVVRLSKKLGFDGFTDMRDALRDSIRERDSLSERFATRLGSDTSKEFEQDVENLRSTEMRVTPDLDTVANTMTGASRVFVAGDRESYGLALFMHRRLHIVLNDVRLIDPAFPDDITCLKPDDVLFACVFPRYSRLTVNLLGSARKAGAKTIVLTDDASLEFLESQDQILIASTKSPRFHWSMVAPMAVLEAVVARAAAANEEAARSRLNETDEFKRARNFFL